MFNPVLFSDLKNYSFQKFMADLFAGLTVGVVALPLAMAFAIACNFSPEKGIFTAITAGFLISFFGGSRVQIGGPTGAFIVIISSIVASHGYSGLAAATLMAGGFLILFGIFKLGALIKFIPFPVVTGFTSGIAVVIFATQLKDIFGLKVEMPESFFGKLQTIITHTDKINYTSFALCAGTVAVIVICQKLFPKLPAMLIGMLTATAVSVIFGLGVETIGDRFGDLPSGLPMPQMPQIEWANLHKLISPAMTIALLAAIESLLSATVADGMTGDRHRSNTELAAQGIGNIGAILFGGIPATGAIARTATNIRCGAKTPVAGLIHALTLTVILLLFAGQAKMIPLAALSGIMVVVCWNMSEYHVFIRMFKGPKSDSGVMLLTFLLTVMVDLIVAIEVGVVLAALLFIRRMSEISDVKVITDELQKDESSHPDDPDATHKKAIPPKVEVYEVHGPFFFGAVDHFKDSVFAAIKKGIKFKIIILRMRYVSAIDATGLNVLSDFLKQCRKRGIELVLSGVQPQPRSAFERYGFMEKIGEENVCNHIDAAIVRCEKLLDSQSE